MRDVAVDQAKLIPVLHDVLFEQLEQDELQFDNLRVQVPVLLLQLPRNIFALEVQMSLAGHALLEAVLPAHGFSAFGHGAFEFVWAHFVGLGDLQ